MRTRVGFFTDQIAGHITNYHNIRKAAALAPEIDPVWNEIHYWKKGGLLEQSRKLLPFVSSYVTGNLRGVWETFKPIATNRYDAIFTNVSVGVFFAPFYRRVPTIINFDSTPILLDAMPAYSAEVDPATVAKIKWLLTRNMYESATIIECWSDWAKRSVVKDYGINTDKIVVNPPGIDLDFWRPNALRQTPATNQPLRVLFVGGDFRRKGGEQLLEWYRSQSPNKVELHIVTREDVASQSGITVYHGIQPNSDQLISLYQQSDLFVLPSLGECFGIATIEAMGAGLPVIATNVGGTADIIEPGRNGYIVPADDVHELGSAIDAVLNDAAARERMRVQSRQLAEERFDLYCNAQRTFGWLTQIARQPVGSNLASFEGN